MSQNSNTYNPGLVSFENYSPVLETSQVTHHIGNNERIRPGLYEKLNDPPTHDNETRLNAISENSSITDNVSRTRSLASKSSKHGSGMCSCMTIELTQLFFQFTFGVGAIVAFTALMFVWDSLNTTPTSLTYGVHLKGKVVRAFVAVAIGINFLRMCQDYRRSTLRFSKLWYRKLTHVAAMVGIGAIALHDRQLSLTFDAISSNKDLNGYSATYYKNVLLAIGALYGLAILFYLVRSAERKKRSCCGICDI